jgi:hypothetical protein
VVDSAIDELGPVDYLVVEFPPGHQNFNGELARELNRLVDAQTIRVLDLMVLEKRADGTVDAAEIEDVVGGGGEVDELVAAQVELADILAADDVAKLAAAMEPGTTCGVVVWENKWAAPFASAARRAGGQLVASGRIPIQALLASIQAEDEANSSGKSSAS